MAMSLAQDLLFLIHQFCVEEKLEKTAHMLEQEAGFYFDMSYFEGLVLDGHWDKAEQYVSGFTGVHDNDYSVKMYFALRKQKYFEALEKHDIGRALEILMKDLNVFKSSNLELYREMTALLTVEDFRNHPSVFSHGNVISGRRHLMNEIKVIIEANPQFSRKLDFPQFEKSRLRRLINQSLNWQHVHCANPLPEPSIKTLFADHRCLNPSKDPNTMSMPASVSAFPGSIVLDESSVPESCVSDTTTNLGNLSNTESNVSAPAANIRNSSKEAVTLEGINQMDSLPSIPSQRLILNYNLPRGFPSTVERSLEMNSSPTSMKFHPSKDTLLLVGNRNGEIELWHIGSEVKLFWNAFMIWRREIISPLFLKDLDKDPQISVNSVSWSPDGSVFGVAYSKQIVQLYSYQVTTNYTKKLQEIDAHLGSVNDLAFSTPDDQLLVVTCGDDKFIQVWDAMTGSKQFTFEGHGAAVYSLCPHRKEDVHFLFSTSINGEIKAWLFDNTGPKVQYDAPGHCCMRMVYSADNQRLFSCGTNKEGESYMVEWDDREGYITRTYIGLCKSSVGLVQFGTSRNRFLAAGDEHLIKIWDVDNVELLAVIDADGGLPANPHICFNKEGTLLAVFAGHNKIKILANDDSHQLLQTSRMGSLDFPGYLSESLEKETSMKLRVPFVLNKGLDTQKCSKIIEVSRCRSLMLPSELKTSKISRLTYTYSGNGILALGEDGIHLLWRWLNDSMTYGRATTNHAPRLWIPRSGFLMINDIVNDASKVVSPCLALSKNDSYVVSSSGRTVSLFNAMTFKKLRSCMLPTATCIGFYPPDNNIIAIGLDDATILVYNVRLGEVTNRLRGHVNRISGFAFSSSLKVLVSSGVDTQIIVWDYNKWEKKNSTSLQISRDWMPSEKAETHVQFYQDQKHFLAVHETQLAVYEATKLERVTQWIIGDFCTRILHAALSSDDQLVYAIMRKGILLILGALDLSPRFEIDPSVYIPPSLGSYVHALVVSAHPQKPHQVALGLSNGAVVILEPAQPQGKWVVEPTFGPLANKPINF